MAKLADYRLTITYEFLHISSSYHEVQIGRLEEELLLLLCDELTLLPGSTARGLAADSVRYIFAAIKQISTEYEPD